MPSSNNRVSALWCVLMTLLLISGLAEALHAGSMQGFFFNVLPS